MADAGLYVEHHDDHAVLNDAPEGGDEEAAEAVPHLDANASVLTTAINMVANVVGGGILSIPMAFAEMSVVPGLIVLLLMCVLSGYSMLLLVLSAAHTGCFTYKELFQRSFKSERAAKALDALIAAYTFGILVGFARIVGDSMPDVSIDFLKAHGAPTKGWFWIVCAAAVFFPLSSLKQLSELKISSAAGFATILYVVGVIVVRFFDGNYEQKGNRDGIVADDTPWFSFRTTFLAAVPLCSVAFCCHYNVPVFYGELKDRSPYRMMKAVALTLPNICTLYVITGLAGVMQFGGERILHHSQGDIMNDFADDDVAMNVGRLGMFVHFVCVYPIVCIACRRSVNMIIFGHAVMSHKVHMIEAFLLVFASCFLAYLVPDVSVIFSVNGAAFGLSIVMILPNLFYLRVLPPPGEGQRWAQLRDGVNGEAATRHSVGGDESDRAAMDGNVEMCDLTTASHEAFFGDEKQGGAPEGGSAEETSAWPARLRVLCQEQHPVMRRLSQVLVVVGFLLSVVCLIVTIVKVATK